MMDREVEQLLPLWDLGGEARVLNEIRHHGRLGRAFMVGARAGQFVAKVTFDQVAFVSPGLRIARTVAQHGIATGPPLDTIDGDVAVPFAHGDAPPTLAMLKFEPGAPIDIAHPESPARLGDLLGRLHCILTTAVGRDDVAAELMTWWRQWFTSMNHSRAVAALDVVVAAGAASLPHGVVYGDPSPEVLDHNGRLAIIDWGTPSWAPLVHDIVSWVDHLHRWGAVADSEVRFVAAYEQHRTIRPEETAIMPAWRALKITAAG